LGSIRTLNGSTKRVEYIVEGTLSKQRTKKEGVMGNINKISGLGRGEQLAFQEMRVDPKTNLNPKYKLDTFIVGSFNELAHSAAIAIIDNVGVKYNPFFVYGGVGLGKTHLIQSIGNEISTKYKNRVSVKYVTSEKFTNDIVWAIRNNRSEEAKKNL